MARKKVDDRIRTLITNAVRTKHRSFFVLVGDKGKDQVPNLHYILSKAQVKARPSVLWCYKNELGFSTHRKKRMRQIKKMVQRGLHDPERDDPFELFISSTDIRWAYYRDSHKVLGQTYGMCVLQDFEALTPNLLARTVETVEGGGIVVILLRSMASLKQLYSMTMDVHARYRTEAHNVVQPRFNERFLLSLSTCETCAVMDDELNILPLSKHIRKIEAVELDADGELGSSVAQSAEEMELAELKRSLEGTQPAAALVGVAKTRDQAKAVLTFIEAVSEKTLRSTVVLTAARGRGKSAALGVGIASAVAYGYSNIFVTSPAPENLATVFEFVFKALDALKYKEHLDYEIIQSTNPDFNKAVVRVNIFHDHRQTIQYIQPHDHEMLAQAELVVIDEAAAIPLPLVRKLLGPYLVFMASTINGYEGTGRSLSLKLLDQLRKKTAELSGAAGGSDWRTNQYMYKKSAIKDNPWADDKPSEQALPSGTGTGGTGATGRVLREIELETPIRYASGDPVEKWLYHVLCLDSAKLMYRLTSGTPHPMDCDLFAVDRDALFSHHNVSESFLQRLMALYVASHYKNSPNDLQLLSDAPAHRLFVLLGKKQAEEAAAAGQLPDVLCIVQVALEGGIARKSIQTQLSQGNRAAGDLVPWMIAQQYQDFDFGKLEGARIVRIATHPDVSRMGYGKRAVELLTSFYQGSMTSLADIGSSGVATNFERGGMQQTTDADDFGDTPLKKQKTKPRSDVPSLMVPIAELPPQRLNYVSVSFGLTQQLFSFWCKTGMRPFYLRQTANELTGEHSCIMLRPLECQDMPGAPTPGWEHAFCVDFARRFLSLLGGPFRELSCTLSLSIADVAMNGTGNSNNNTIERLPQQERVDARAVNSMFLPHDLKRLDAYARNLVDYHMVADLLPTLAHLFLQDRMPATMSLSPLQRALLIGMGLQGKTVDSMSSEFGMPSTQLLAMFNKSVRKFAKVLREVLESEAGREMDKSEAMKSALKVGGSIRKGKALKPLAMSLEDEQDTDGKVGEAALAAGQKADLLQDVDLSEYAIEGDSAAWDQALAKAGTSGMLSVKSSKKRKSASVNAEGGSSGDKKTKKDGGGDKRSSKDAQKEKFSRRDSAGKHRRKKNK